MTKITLHGILAKEFQKCFNLSIKRPKEIFDAISCSHPQFRHRLAELARQGIHFTLLIDGKKIERTEDLCVENSKSIDVVPLICGAGDSGAIIALIVIGIFTAGAGLALGVGATGWVAVAAQALTSLGTGMILMGLQMALAPKPEMERPSSDVSASKQSFNFSSKANVAEQGIPVPVGYGRLRVGSAIIQSNLKSYPQAFEEKDIFDQTSTFSQARTNIKS